MMKHPNKMFICPDRPTDVDGLVRDSDDRGYIVGQKVQVRQRTLFFHRLNNIIIFLKFLILYR